MKILKYTLITLLLALLLFPVTKAWFINHHLRTAYIFIISFILASLLTPPSRAVALKMRLLDYPNERKVHRRPTPLLGGVAIYLAFTIALLYNFTFSLALKGVMAGGTIILVMGVIDDKKSLPAEAKLLGQIIAALVMIKCGVVLTFLPPTLWGQIGEVLLTIIWVVGITNGLNFLDGMDGLAAGLTIIAGLSFLVIALQTNQPWLGFLTIALAGSCAGFLPYNFKPATIFLGDAGSTFLGFTLAGIAVMGYWAVDNPVVSLSVPVLILGVLIFNMIYVTISRIRIRKVSSFREWVGRCAKDHLHHHLAALGLSEKQTVIFIYLISLCLGIGAIVLRYARTVDALLMLGQAAIIFVIIVVLMTVGRRGLRR